MDSTKKITYHSNYWYNDGLKRAQIRDTSGAIVSLRRSLQYNRENIAARNLLGLVYYGRGEVAEALVEWIISRNFRQRDNIANEYLRNIQNSNKELGAVNQAVKRYNQCLAYCAQGAEDMAVIQLKRAVSMHPTFLKAYQLLALLYLHSGQYAQARQMLKEARKLDTTNEMTLRYMQELKRMQGRRSRQGGRAEEPGKNEIVEYKRGNDTLIQPRPSTVHRSGGGFFNLLIGMLMGAAIVWFLIAPAVQESKAAQMNKEILDYSERIGSLEAQISAQTRMLDSYRATSADTEAAAQNAASTLDSYENLMNVSDQYDSRGYSEDVMADTLLNVNRDALGGSGQALYDELAGNIFPYACRILYNAAMESYNVANYDAAADNLDKVVRMDEGYEDGNALLHLGLSCRKRGDAEAATRHLGRVVELFPETEQANTARAELEAIAMETNAPASPEGEDSGQEGEDSGQEGENPGDPGQGGENGEDGENPGENQGQNGEGESGENLGQGGEG